MTLEKLAKQIFDECAKEGEPVTMEEAQEMAQMEINAKGIKIGARATEPKAEKEKKQRIAQVSAEKQKIFKDIVNFLQKNYNISVEKDNKLLKITENGKVFKLDLIETRQKKG